MDSSNDVPQSVRVRCDDGNEHRYRAIERASRFYGVNKSDSVAYACNDIAELAGTLKEILNHDDLTMKQRREIAERLDQTAFLDVGVGHEVSVESDR